MPGAALDTASSCNAGLESCRKACCPALSCSDKDCCRSSRMPRRCDASSQGVCSLSQRSASFARPSSPARACEPHSFPMSCHLSAHACTYPHSSIAQSQAKIRRLRGPVLSLPCQAEYPPGCLQEMQPTLRLASPYRAPCFFGNM